MLMQNRALVIILTMNLNATLFFNYDLMIYFESTFKENVDKVFLSTFFYFLKKIRNHMTEVDAITVHVYVCKYTVTLFYIVFIMFDFLF